MEKYECIQKNMEITTTTEPKCELNLFYYVYGSYSIFGLHNFKFDPI